MCRQVIFAQVLPELMERAPHKVGFIDILWVLTHPRKSAGAVKFCILMELMTYGSDEHAESGAD